MISSISEYIKSLRHPVPVHRGHFLTGLPFKTSRSCASVWSMGEIQGDQKNLYPREEFLWRHGSISYTKIYQDMA